MTAKASRPHFASVLALLAVALLTHAGVRAAVMQAAMEARLAGSCSMAAMAGMEPMRSGKAEPGKSAPPCQYCAAAAHAPLDVAPTPFAPPVGRTVFARFDAPAARGPRGPPLRRPSARDPPSALPA